MESMGRCRLSPIVIMPLFGLIGAATLVYYICKGGWRDQPFSPIAFLLAAGHLALCFKIENGPQDWFAMFLVDFPASLFVLLVGNFFENMIETSALAVFGTVGTIWWYAVGCSVAFTYRKFGSVDG